jgi:hypothetical protein
VTLKWKSPIMYIEHSIFSEYSLGGPWNQLIDHIKDN